MTACEEETENRFRYTGEQFDAITKQYYLRARFYNPVIARFTQEDTYRGAGLNLYAYCANNPVGYVDPSGHQPQCVKDAAAKYMADGLGKEEAYRKAYQDHVKQKLANAASLPVQELIKLEERARRLGLEVDSSVNRKKNPEAKTPDEEQRDGRESGGSFCTTDRIRNVAQQSFDYAVNNPRKQGLNRMQLGKDVEIQATRWIRKWAERNGIDLSERGLHFQVRGEHSIPDVVYEPTKNIMDFKLTPKAVRKKQSDNFKRDFPGYSIEYIFGPGPWRE